jgi:hypothetical protein
LSTQGEGEEEGDADALNTLKTLKTTPDDKSMSIHRSKR